MARPDKETSVSEIKDKLSRAKSVILTDYRGLSFEQITELRSKLRPLNVEYKVFKNTLAKRATKELDLEDLDQYLNGPTAMAISYDDPVASAKPLSDFAKATKMLEMKGGVVEGSIVDSERVKSLASIPSREVLLAMFMGGLRSPLYGLAGSLNQITAGLARVLSQVAQQKGA
jgi:large subunit ribosomal protein L10